MKYNSAAHRIHGALIYARFSTEHQSEKSIEEQVADCRRWCESNGLSVLGIYPDYAVSGMKASRPQFDAMMDALRIGQADTVVCFDQSRLARDFLNWFSLRQELETMGVRIVSITQDYVGGNIYDSSVLIQETIIALHNQMHIADTKRKVKAALRYRAQSGQHTGGKPPLGYDLISKRLVINPSEAATVLRIFTEYAAGKSYKQIMDALNADGVKTKSGKSFGSNSLHDLIKNRRYIGEFTFGGKAYDNAGHRVRGKVPEDAITIQHPELAIIPESLFEEVQIRMAKNQHAQAGRKPSAREYPLKGKVFCGECGSAMSIAATTAKGHRYTYYECAAQKRTHECACRKIRADELEDKVSLYVRSILCNADVVALIRQEVKKEVNSVIAGGIEKAEAAARELSSVDAKLERVVDAIAETGKSDALLSRLRSLEAERTQLQAKLTSLRNAAEISAAPEAMLDKLLETIVQNYSEAAVLSIVTRVEVFSNSIRIFTAFDPEHDPHTPIDDSEFIKITGIPSGVPSIFISPYGLLIDLCR